jgi:DUF4097 and DUF4098 domain-containing protein YvlB
MTLWALLKPLLRTLCLIAATGWLTPAMAVERSVQKTFPVSAGATLKVNTYRGSVIVEDSDEAEIRAEVRIELATEDPAAADRILQGLDLALTADGNTVTVLARNPRESRARFTWTDQKLDLSFRLRVPHACNLEITTIDGDITVGHVTGNVTAHARAGTISCRQIDGAVTATMDLGDIVVSRCTGAVDLTVTRGSLRVGTIFGPAKLRNASGDIEIQSARGGVTASTAAGDITAGFPRQLAGNADLKVDGGSIEAKLDPAVRCEVHASSIWGQVRSALPFEPQPGGNSKRLLIGKLNGGGPLLTLRASGGNVKLEPSSQFLD